MPELPEVEVTARGLTRGLQGREVQDARVHERRLRWPVTAGLAGRLRGQRLAFVGRRGKYLLWHFPSGVLISHLGMSGSWRLHEGGAAVRERHDHVEIEFRGRGTVLARYNDPRRFGALLWHPASRGNVLDHPLLSALGIEPFDPQFDGRYLLATLRGLRAPVKQVLLAGRAVVGVGNIYATECLFEARIHPAARAGSLGRVRCERLARSVRHVLGRAIDAGGSTLRDFSHVDGIAGDYTVQALAYDREGMPCPRCGTGIRRIVQGARASYFCPRCQRA
jgi:formamidopyrimidine-DNA glycosylase